MLKQDERRQKARLGLLALLASQLRRAEEKEGVMTLDLALGCLEEVGKVCCSGLGEEVVWRAIRGRGYAHGKSVAAHQTKA